MSRIETVLGPIAPSELGQTLLHEHIAWKPYGWPVGSFGSDGDRAIDMAGTELAALRAAGIHSLVDATNIGNGRDPVTIAEISRRSGMHVVAVTGFWCDPPLIQLVGTDDIDGLAEQMVRELREGMDGTSVCAGIIKVSSSMAITRAEERAIRAAARASRQTGAAVTTHTDMGEQALEQLNLLAEEGADLSRVVVGHLGGRLDLDLHLAICRRGAYLGYDRVGMPNMQSDAHCADMIVAIANRGYLSQITVSHDSAIFIMGEYRPPLPPSLPARRGLLEERPSYAHVLQSFLPRLRKAGLPANAAQHILVENPARLLAM